MMEPNGHKLERGARQVRGGVPLHPESDRRVQHVGGVRDDVIQACLQVLVSSVLHRNPPKKKKKGLLP